MLNYQRVLGKTYKKWWTSGFRVSKVARLLQPVKLLNVHDMINMIGTKPETSDRMFYLSINFFPSIEYKIGHNGMYNQYQSRIWSFRFEWKLWVYKKNSTLMVNHYFLATNTLHFSGHPPLSTHERWIIGCKIPTFSPQLPTTLNFLNLVDLHYRIY